MSYLKFLNLALGVEDDLLRGVHQLLVGEALHAKVHSSREERIKQYLMTKNTKREVRGIDMVDSEEAVEATEEVSIEEVSSRETTANVLLQYNLCKIVPKHFSCSHYLW